MNSYVGNSPTTGHFPTDTFISSGGSTYTLSKAPATLGSIEVSVQGVLQAVSAYTINGTELELVGVANDDVIFVRHLGETLQIPTPGDDTVGLNQLSATGTPSASVVLKGDNSWGTIEGSEITTVGTTFSNYNTISGNTTTTTASTKNMFLLGQISVNDTYTWTIAGDGVLQII